METALKMLKKVELATEGRTSSASKTLVMKANVLFGISDNDGKHKERKSAKMWTGGSVDGSTLNTCHTTSTCLESQEKKHVEVQVWPEGLIYVFLIQGVFSQPHESR